MRLILTAAAGVLLCALLPGVAAGATDCAFATSGQTQTLLGDCTTDETIVVPDGVTLDGGGYTITAVDPPGSSFTGAVIRNGGAVAHVTNVVVTSSGLRPACHPSSPDQRLRGIMFDGAEGSITYSTVTGVNQGASGCQEGNAIEVRSAPFDGSHPDTKTVEVAHNTVDAYQKTGIVANGDVAASIHHNAVGASATQANLAANGIQLGFGAFGTIVHNHVAGNQWCGGSNFAATAILVYAAGAGSVISNNNVGGNADIGLYLFADGLVVDNNRVFDDPEIADCSPWGYDIGVGNWGAGNAVTNNKVRGYSTAYDGVEGGNNKTISDPNA